MGSKNGTFVFAYGYRPSDPRLSDPGEARPEREQKEYIQGKDMRCQVQQMGLVAAGLPCVGIYLKSQRQRQEDL